MRRRWLIPVGLVVILAAVGFGLWWFRYDTYHFAAVKDGVLYRDGVRSERTFKNAVRKANLKTVVRLIDPNEQHDEPFVAEEKYCREHGIEVVNIPIKLGGWPTAIQVQEFLAVTADESRQPLLVHCAQGVRRTGMMVAAYQESVLGFDRQKSTDAILRFGHSDRSIGDVRKFIEVYDPKTHAVPGDLPVGKEGSTTSKDQLED